MEIKFFEYFHYQYFGEGVYSHTFRMLEHHFWIFLYGVPCNNFNPKKKKIYVLS